MKKKQYSVVNMKDCNTLVVVGWAVFMFGTEEEANIKMEEQINIYGQGV